MAKKRSEVASMNPDNMAAAGLADDFDGEVTEVRLVPFNYDGNIDHHVLSARVTITPDKDSDFEEFQQYYSAGDLEFFESVVPRARRGQGCPGLAPKCRARIRQPKT